MEAALPGLMSRSMVGVRDGSKRSSRGSVRSTTDALRDGEVRRLLHLPKEVIVMADPFCCGRCLCALTSTVQCVRGVIVLNYFGAEATMRKVACSSPARCRPAIQ